MLSQPKNYEPCEGINNGVEDILLEKQHIILYPNPTKELFSVSVPGGEKLEKVQVFDLTGRFLFESAEETVDVSRLDRGVYCVKVFLTNRVVVDELVKE